MVRWCIFIILFSIFLVFGCSTTKTISSANDDATISEKRWTKKELFHFKLYMLIESYAITYVKPPKSAEDLIMFINRMDDENKMMYDTSLKYLKKNSSRLIFETDLDSVTTIYKGIIKDSRIVEKVPFIGPCGYVNSAEIYFFDNKGFNIRNESAKLKIQEELNRLYKSHSGIFMFENGESHKAIIEYTKDGLKNICSYKIIDLSKSPFFSDLYNYVNELADRNNFSRIVFPAFVDKHGR